MPQQTKITFLPRKTSSRLVTRSSKYLNEKENETSYSPRRSSRACSTSPIRTEAPVSSSESDNEDSAVESSPPEILSPSKRKMQKSEALSSPPKVRCQGDIKRELTPSTRLTKLNLNSPQNKPAPPTENSTDKAPRKALFPDKQVSTDEFQKARLAFHTSSTDSLPGREAELAELKEFLTSHINSGTSGSVYISGPPGTGKTACLTHLMSHKEIKGHFQTIYVNCTSMKSPGALYSQIAVQLNLKIRGRPTEKSCLNAIEKHLSSRHKMLLFVFDELDQLESRSQSVLYTVFEWPITHPQGLVLVGIANALDLTDRTLPRLRAREDLTPKLLHFAPYSRQQIINILKLRLEEAGVGNVFSAPALQMLASKVASVSGDVRRALDIGRRVIEMTGNPFHDNPQPVPVTTVLKTTDNNIPAPSFPIKIEGDPKTPVKSVPPSRLGSPEKPMKTRTSPRKLLLSPPKSNPASLVPKAESPRKTSPRKLFESPVRRTVDLKGVMTVVGEVYGSSQSSGLGANEVPLQQRLAVCSLLLILKNSKSKDVTVAKLHEVYRRVCNKRRFEPLDQAAFLSMLSLVEARGLLSIQGKGRPSRLSKVCLKWVEDEVVAALKDKDLLASILKDVACLS